MLSTGVVASAANEDAPDHGADWIAAVCLSWCEVGAAMFPDFSGHIGKLSALVLIFMAFMFAFHAVWLRGEVS